MEAWRQFVPGARVRVTTPISNVERPLVGKEFTFVRYSNPHGYAVLEQDGTTVQVHPESLVEV